MVKLLGQVPRGSSACPFFPYWLALQSVQQNGSIYIHVYFTKSGFHPDPRQKALYRRLATVHMSRSKHSRCVVDPQCQVPEGRQAAQAQGGWDRAPPTPNLCLCGHL